MYEKGLVYCNADIAGVLKKTREGYFFEYTEDYFTDTSKQAISLTLPKTQKTHYSKFLHPLFFNMLAEGANKALQCKWLKIDEEDYYSLLMATSNSDNIGAVYVIAESKITNEEDKKYFR